jgi:hypothetical protein
MRVGRFDGIGASEDALLLSGFHDAI